MTAIFNELLGCVESPLVAHQRFLGALKAHFGIQNALLMRIKSAVVLPGSEHILRTNGGHLQAASAPHKFPRPHLSGALRGVSRLFTPSTQRI